MVDFVHLALSERFAAAIHAFNEHGHRFGILGMVREIQAMESELERLRAEVSALQTRERDAAESLLQRIRDAEM